MHGTGTWDAIVVGLGATGSAAVCHLAGRGLRVLGIDQFAPPHDRGSSHGGTRIYRQAYYEAPEYVPLARRALELWRELERVTGRALFSPTGGLTVGRPDGELLPGALASARLHGIPHEELSATEVERRFPAFRVPDGAAGLFEPTAGVLFPERCIGAHLDMAQARSAEIRVGEAVLAMTGAERDGVSRRGAGGATNSDRLVRVTTTRGEYVARSVIAAPGAWAPSLLGLRGALRVTRESVHWFQPRNAHARAPHAPVAMIEHGGGEILYTIPDFGDGFKAGLHRTGPGADVAAEHASPTAEEIARVRTSVDAYAPGGSGLHVKSNSCYYTSTSDGHFAIGTLPGNASIILASACSGHGFKFASALGEALAQLVLGEPTLLPASLFDPARL